MSEGVARLPSGISIAWEDFGEGEPVLLVMGLGAQMLLWPESFCEQLADRGYRVIRFDNRDTGGSTRLNDAGVVPVPELLAAWMGRRRRKAPYLLADMADDAFGLMDALRVEHAHVVGASMGGMIAQTMAILRPARVRSLTSIMSTTGSRRVGYPHPRSVRALLTPPRPGEDGAAEHFVRFIRQTGSPRYPSDPAELEALARRCYRRGPTDAGFSRQLMAILASGNRTEALGRLPMPTLVVHGTDDPLVHVSGGEATAAAVPGARLERVEGMGHDLPAALWPRFLDAMEATWGQPPSLRTSAT